MRLRKSSSFRFRVFISEINRSIAHETAGADRKNQNREINYRLADRFSRRRMISPIDECEIQQRGDEGEREIEKETETEEEREKARER